MATTFMNSEKSKNFDLHVLILKLTNKLRFKNRQKGY